jgi:hypothetical protein
MPKQKSHIRVGCVFMREELCQRGHNAQLAYFWLLSYSNGDPNGTCYPSRETLAKQMGISVRSLADALTELEAVQLIERTPQARSKLERFQSTRYRVHKSA